MLNNLFESICVTSAVAIRSNLYICSPPFIYLNDQKHPLNAKTIYVLRNEVIVILTLDNQIKFINSSFEIISQYTIQQMPIAIHAYQDFIIVEYEFEYQQCYIEELKKSQKKNKIASFAPNHNNVLTYIIRNHFLENNQIYHGGGYMEIEMGVEQIYPISRSKDYYIYQSKVLPQITIIDLGKLEEIEHLEFSSQIDQVFILSHSFLIQSENKLFQLKSQEFVEFNTNIQMRVSCIQEWDGQLFIGSVCDNSIIMKNNQIIKSYYNLGQIVDIHPCNQICYIASYNKIYPVSLFRKGINENILERFKFPNEIKPRKVFFLTNQLILLSYANSSEIYNATNFSIYDINLIKNEKTINIYTLQDAKIAQITTNKIIIFDISLNTILFEKQLDQKIQDTRFHSPSLNIYLYLENNEIRQYNLKNLLFEILNTQIVNHLSAFQVINNQLFYCCWYQFELHNFNETKIYMIQKISSTIVSMEQTQNYILLGLNDGNLVALCAETLQFHKIFLISNTHPIKLMRYKNKVILFSHHMYMIDNQLQQIIINWDHVYDFSFCDEKLVGIVQNEIQIVNLSQGSSSQCRELKFISNKEVLSLRFFKDHLVILTASNQLINYFDDQQKNVTQINFQIEKMEEYNNLYLAGHTVNQQGKIIIVNELLQQIYQYNFIEPIYDLKLYNNVIYFISNTAIHTNNGLLSYNFNIPIKGFDIKDKNFLIYENLKGMHLFYYDERMISLGSLSCSCQYASFYYEDVICFSDTNVKIAKLNLLTYTISDKLEILAQSPIEVTCVKDKFYGTLYGVLGYYE